MSHIIQSEQVIHTTSTSKVDSQSQTHSISGQTLDALDCDVSLDILIPATTDITSTSTSMIETVHDNNTFKKSSWHYVVSLAVMMHMLWLLSIVVSGAVLASTCNEKLCNAAKGIAFLAGVLLLWCIVTSFTCSSSRRAVFAASTDFSSGGNKDVIWVWTLSSWCLFIDFGMLGMWIPLQYEINPNSPRPSIYYFFVVHTVLNAVNMMGLFALGRRPFSGQ